MCGQCGQAASATQLQLASNIGPCQIMSGPVSAETHAETPSALGRALRCAFFSCVYLSCSLY